MTQEQLAEKLNISVKHYGGVERENPAESVPGRVKEIYLNSPPDKRQHIMELLEVVNRF